MADPDNHPVNKRHWMVGLLAFSAIHSKEKLRTKLMLAIVTFQPTPFYSLSAVVSCKDYFVTLLLP